MHFNSTDKFTYQYLRAAFRHLASKVCFHPVAARVVAEYLGDVEVRNMVHRVLHPKLFQANGIVVKPLHLKRNMVKIRGLFCAVVVIALDQMHDGLAIAI
jgi:hypothetical protein